MKITSKPPAYASRAIGILEGRIRPYPPHGPLAVIITTIDGTEIPGIVHQKAKDRIVEDPSLISKDVRCLIYPRTRKALLEAIVIDLEEIEPGKKPTDPADEFLIQGFNIGSRVPGQVQIGIRPNSRSPHNFERFWITLFGHVNRNEKCVYQIKAVRKGRKLFILESDPQLPDSCKQKKKQPEKQKARTLIRR